MFNIKINGRDKDFTEAKFVRVFEVISLCLGLQVSRWHLDGETSDVIDPDTLHTCNVQVAALIIYTLVGNNLVNLVDHYAYIDEIKKWGSIFIGLMIVIFLIYHFKTVKAYLDSEDFD
jgi:predicted Abi (CAAX) family protease